MKEVLTKRSYLSYEIGTFSKRNKIIFNPFRTNVPHFNPFAPDALLLYSLKISEYLTVF